MEINETAGRRFRIGISGSYGGMNLGDEAILEGILGQIRATISADVTVFSMNPATFRSSSTTRIFMGSNLGPAVEPIRKSL